MLVPSHLPTIPYYIGIYIRVRARKKVRNEVLGSLAKYVYIFPKVCLHILPSILTSFFLSYFELSFPFFP